jgi:hypothetical protein
VERTGSTLANTDKPAAFCRTHEAFHRALEAGGDAVTESYFTFAGRAVRARIVGRDLANHVARAFAHLAGPVCPTPRLTIDLWDQGETGIEYPEGEPPDQTEHIDVESKAGDGMVTGYRGAAVLRYRIPGAVTWLDRRANHILGWRRSAQSTRVHERSKPFPVLLAIWYFDQEIHVVHAGLVAKRAQGLLIGGASGSGKTTTALACALGGFDYLGDDHVGLGQAGGEFVGYSLYNGVRIAPGHGERFPATLPFVVESDNPKDDKRLVLLADIPGVQVTQHAGVRAILLPRVVGRGPSRVVAASRRDALLRLAPTSVFTPFGPGSRGFRRLADLVESVPAYWLDLGAEVSEIPAAVGQILS